MQRIGVRELRQHASRYLAMVEQGEHIEVSDRGRPVAMLVPLRRSAWDDLVSSQRVASPEDDADIADEDPGAYEANASAVLRTMRDIER